MGLLATRFGQFLSGSERENLLIDPFADAIDGV